MKRTGAIALLLVVFGGYPLALGQSASSRQELVRERVRIETVRLDLIATDRSGETVRDLTLDELVVLENGKPVEVAGLEVLEVLDLRAPADPASPPLRGEARLQFILALDLVGATGLQIRETFHELQRFLDNLPRYPGLEYTVYSLDHGSVLDGFTEDPLAVWRALEALEPSVLEAGDANGASEDSTRGPADLDQLVGRFEACRTEDGKPNRPVPLADMEVCLREVLDGYLATQESRTDREVKRLGDLAYGYGEPTILRNVLLISPGLSLTPGVEGVRLARQLLDVGGHSDFFPANPTGTPQTPDTAPSPNLSQPRSFAREVRHLTHAAMRNRISFFTNGLPQLPQETTTPPKHADPVVVRAITKSYRNEQRALVAGLDELAWASGGLFSEATLSIALRDAVESNRFVYTLSYPARGEAAGEYREVEVRCKRKGVNLRYRQGYYDW